MFHFIFEIIFKEINKYLKNIDLNNPNFNRHILLKQCESIFINQLQLNSLNIIGYISKISDNITYFNKSHLEENSNIKEYIVVFNPLDGITNFTININTGSIYAIYEFDKSVNKIINIVDSGYCLYGLNTIMIYSNGTNVIMTILNTWENFSKIKNIKFNDMECTTISKTYSINQSKDYNPEIVFLLQQYKNKNYNMRWIGTFVADIHRILLNGGIFYYPENNLYLHGKISLLYESIPIAYLFKLANGFGLNGNYKNILDNIINFNININTIHSKSSIILASNYEYHNLINLLELYEINKS
jgi:fructose-1,6-bisphosphatase I